jgi:hypothetical protein
MKGESSSITIAILNSLVIINDDISDIEDVYCTAKLSA